MQVLSNHIPAAAASRLARLIGARHGLDDGERALVGMIVAHQARRADVAADYARRAIEALVDDRIVAVLQEEGPGAPLTGRLGALADAAGALAQVPSGFGDDHLKRLRGQRFDSAELGELFETVAKVQADLKRKAAPLA